MKGEISVDKPRAKTSLAMRLKTFGGLFALVVIGIAILLLSPEASVWATPEQDSLRRTIPCLGSFLPFIAKDHPSAWDTGCQVQNFGSEQANVVMEYYDERGITPVFTDSAIVDVERSKAFDQPDISDTDLPDGRYSVIVECDQPVGAVANETNYTLGIAGSYNGLCSGATRVSLPLVFRGHSDWYSTFAVQNTETVTASVTIRFYSTGSATPALEKTDTIPPRVAHYYETSDPEYAPLGDSWYGSVIVTSDKGVVVVVNQIKLTDDAHLMLALPGLTYGATELVAPLVFKNYSPNDASGWTTGIQVQNWVSTTATVSMTFDRTNGPGSWTITKTVAANSFATFYMPDYPDIPDGSYGSAVIACTTGQPIAAVVSHTKYATDMAMGYNAFSAGSSTTKIGLPLWFKNYQGTAGWVSGISVRNLGDTPTDIKVTLTQENGTGSWIKWAYNVAPNSSAVFYLPNYADIPNGAYGSAVVDSPDGQPIIAIVNHTKYGADAAMSYGGINY